MAVSIDPVEKEHLHIHRSYSSLGKKYRKGRVISQRYTKQEIVQDTRRETARRFLLSIPLDKNPVAVTHGRLRSLSKLQTEDLSECMYINKGEVSALPQTQLISTIQPSATSLQRNISVIDSPRTSKRKFIGKKYSQAQIGGDTIGGLAFKDLFADTKRMVFLSNGYPLMYSSLLPYERPGKKSRLDGPVSSHHRIRTNSSSAHVDIVGGIDYLLDTAQELSLASSGMLTALWVNEGTTSTTAFSPLTSRYQPAIKRTPLTHQLSLREGLPSPPPLDAVTATPSFHLFRDNHSPQFVVVNYHPDCFDNRDLFMGRLLTILNLPGYTVSVIKYAHERDIKKALNEKFSEVFPHVRITLTKLRSIKQEMLLFGSQFGLGPVLLAHSYVYFEKLVLMGNVNKTNRKILAYISLILAAKFASDTRRAETKTLIEEISDKLKISQKDLMSFEFPTLVALHFSLLTPLYQLQSHFDKITKDLNK